MIHLAIPVGQIGQQKADSKLTVGIQEQGQFFANPIIFLRKLLNFGF